MPRLVQSAFARGEVAPALYGRVDTNLYQLAVRKAWNMIVHVHGGMSNRGGLHYLEPCFDHNNLVRLIEFRFKQEDTLQIELGPFYVRMLRNGRHVAYPGVNVIGATQANPVVIQTDVPHGFFSGEEVRLENIGGMTEISGYRWSITVLTADTFQLQCQVDATTLDGTAFTAYTSGGTASKILTLATPYQESDLRDLTFTQSADVMTICHVDHDPQELTRLSLTSWTLTANTFAPSQASPASSSATARVPASSTWKYQVTAIADDATKEESLPALSTGPTVTITGATQANPCVLTTAAAHGMDDSDEFQIDGVVGMTELNGRRYHMYVVDATHLQLRNVNSTGYTAYASGGTMTPAFAKVVNGNLSHQVTVNWATVTGAGSYHIYREQEGVYGYIGAASTLEFKDDTAFAVDLQHTPPQERNPLLGTDNHPGAIGSHQQRRVFGGSNNRPDTSFYTRTGTQSNLSVATPTRDDDAITATLPATEIEQIRHYLSADDLLVFTYGSEWAVQYSQESGFTAASIAQVPRSNWGCASPRPLKVGSTIIWVVFGGVMIRSFAPSFDTDQTQRGRVTSDLTLLIPHLVLNDPIVDWTYVRLPDPLVLTVQTSGRMLAVTIQAEQETLAWCQWHTAGKFISAVASRPVPSSTMESAYCVVRRMIDGRQVQYIERTDTRQATDVRDAFFVDSGLSYDVPVAIEGITLANPAVITITGHTFVDGDVVDIDEVVWTPEVDAVGTETQPAQLNGHRYVVANAAANTFTLQNIDDGTDIDSSAWQAYVEDGVVRKAISTVLGLRHLANTEVAILADGNVLPRQTVSDVGTLTLTRKFSRIHIGLPYVADGETLDMEAPGSQTLQGTKKRISVVNVRFQASRGLLIGPSLTQLTEMRQRDSEPMGAPTALFTGEKKIPITSTWNAHGRIYWRQRDPLPMTILAVVPEIDIGD